MANAIKIRVESGIDEESGLNPPDRSDPAIPECDSLSTRLMDHEPDIG